MEHEAQFSWFQFVPFLNQLPNHVAGSIVVALVLVLFSLFARFALVRKPDYLVPHEKLTFLNFCDIVSENLYKITQNVLGDHAAKFFPIVGALFLFILFSNLMGLIPGLSPPTDNVNTTLACGAFVFLYYNYVGFRTTGFAYLKHFLGPVWYMAWLLLPIEIISHSVRPFTLALRLRGNMLGDHTVLSVFTNLSPYVVPVPIYFLGLLVCFLQAFIFVMLTMVYVSMAKESDHH